MGNLISDARYAIRLLVRRPLLTITALLSLTIGIGANATVFNWVKAFLLRPYPGVERPEELVLVGELSPSGTHNSLSYPNYVDMVNRMTTLQSIVVFRDAPAALGDPAGTGQPERLFGSLVSGNFFDALGVGAHVGRTFLPHEDRTPNTHPVVVLSHALWERRFGANPAIVGTAVTLNGSPFDVIGVAPEGFFGTFMGVSTDLWIPIAMEAKLQPFSRLNSRGDHWLQAIGRLRTDVPLVKAQAEMDTVMGQLAREFPDTNEGRTARLYNIWEAPFGAANVLKPVLMVLFVVVGLVLLIACANVANLLLVRALGRRREMAMRVSLGASRSRLIRQMTVESLVLASIAGAAAVAMTPWTTELLVAIVPPTGAPIHLDGSIDPLTTIFTLVVTALAALAFGLAPAFQSTRADLMTTLKSEATAAVGGSRSRLRSALVVAQVALSVFLLIGAGLFLRSLGQARQIDTGFAHNNLILAAYDLFPLGYTGTTGPLFHRELLERMRQVPGVEAASMSRRVPLGFGGTSSTSFTVEGYEPAPNEELNVLLNNIGPGYFETIGLPVTAGREFASTDQGDSAPVVIVNETMARRYWAGRNAVGSRMRVSGAWREVVGVVRDARYVSLSEPPQPYFYLPVSQVYQANMVLHVRYRQSVESTVAEIRSVFRQMNPNLPVTDIKTIDEHLQLAVVPQRIAATLLSAFGSMALLLSAIGLYGVLAYLVSQRTREVGIRMALGARRAQVLRLVAGQGLKLILAGLGIGLALAVATTRILASQLHGISPTDPPVFVLVPVLLLVVALIAVMIPTARALKIDPMRALRQD